MEAPKLDATEALHHVVAEFVDSIRNARKFSLMAKPACATSEFLKPAQQSIKQGGRQIKVKSAARSAPVT
ncbi:MAG: hypothetical protein ACT4OT_07815 [Acidobacteriota bacterium]